MRADGGSVSILLGDHIRLDVNDVPCMLVTPHVASTITVEVHSHVTVEVHVVVQVSGVNGSVCIEHFLPLFQFVQIDRELFMFGAVGKVDGQIRFSTESVTGHDDGVTAQSALLM